MARKTMSLYEFSKTHFQAQPEHPCLDFVCATRQFVCELDGAQLGGGVDGRSYNDVGNENRGVPRALAITSDPSRQGLVARWRPEGLMAHRVSAERVAVELAYSFPGCHLCTEIPLSHFSFDSQGE